MNSKDANFPDACNQGRTNPFSTSWVTRAVYVPSSLLASEGPQSPVTGFGETEPSNMTLATSENPTVTMSCPTGTKLFVNRVSWQAVEFCNAASTDGGPNGENVVSPTAYYGYLKNGGTTGTVTWSENFGDMFGYPCPTYTDASDYQLAVNYTCVPYGVPSYTGVALPTAPSSGTNYTLDVTALVFTASQYNNATKWDNFQFTLSSYSPDCTVTFGQGSQVVLSYTTSQSTRCSGSVVTRASTVLLGLLVAMMM